MRKSWQNNKILIGAASLLTLFIVLLLSGTEPVPSGAGSVPAYESRLFDSSRVHTIDIQTDSWGAFLRSATEEEYMPCDVVIDGETFRHIGLRAKGNNSLHLTEEYGLWRYSLKLEFDCFRDGGNYYGLDKFSLDSSFQDNSCLKTYMAYDMMRFMEVPSPLCSYVWVTVNGEPWGLFLAIEEPEEAFARRNFGADHGQLYKPDYRSLNDENADVALKYIDDSSASYPGIFDNAKFTPSGEEKQRLIEALKVLSTGENLETAIDVDEVLRYFTAQIFVMNWDSYVGHTGHNYFLYEEDGILSILPWDYNLAFGTYALGMTAPIRDPELLINYPINTPAEGKIMLNRPLYHNLMQNSEYFTRYHRYFDQFISGYFENGRFEETLQKMEELIAPYVQKDPTAFCSFSDHKLAVDTLRQVCLLRAESIRGQLDGSIPATLRGQLEQPDAKIDASGIVLENLGDFEDLENAKEKQDAALKQVLAGN